MCVMGNCRKAVSGQEGGRNNADGHALGMWGTQRREQLGRTSSAPMDGDFGNKGLLWDSLTEERRSVGSDFEWVRSVSSVFLYFLYWDWRGVRERHVHRGCRV